MIWKCDQKTEHLTFEAWNITLKGLEWSLKLRVEFYLGILDPPAHLKKCSKLKYQLLVQIYCNFLKDVRLGGWGTEGPKAWH